MGLSFKTFVFQNMALPVVKFVKLFPIERIQAVMAIFVCKKISELEL